MLVVPCRDATTVLDLVEEALNQIAIFIEVGAEADRGCPIAFRRDVSPRAPFGDKCSDPVRVIPAISEKPCMPWEPLQ